MCVYHLTAVISFFVLKSVNLKKINFFSDGFFCIQTNGMFYIYVALPFYSKCNLPDFLILQIAVNKCAPIWSKTLKKLAIHECMQ